MRRPCLSRRANVVAKRLELGQIAVRCQQLFHRENGHRATVANQAQRRLMADHQHRLTAVGPVGGGEQILRTLVGRQVGMDLELAAQRFGRLQGARGRADQDAAAFRQVAVEPIGFFLAWLLAFPLNFGGIGIWFGFLLGLASAAAMLCARFYILVRTEKAASA